MTRQRDLTCALLALALSGWACSSNVPTDTEEEDRPPACSATEARQCADAHASAKELLDTHAACNPGDSCVIVSQPDLGVACSANVLFHCPFALNARTDTLSFVNRARGISAAAQVCHRCRLACAIPSCVPPDSVSAVCGAVGRCVLQPK
jgi:hypothetical protein